MTAGAASIVHLEGLVGDIATRARVGEELAVAVRRAHAGERWLADLDATYALMTERTGARAGATPAAPGACERLDELLVEIGLDVREGVGAVSSWYTQRWPRRVLRVPVLMPDPPHTTWGSATTVDVVESVITGAAGASETLLGSAEQTLGARVARWWARWLGRRRLSRQSP